MQSDKKLALWDAYQQQANPIMVEDGDGWVELTVGQLVNLIKNVLREQRHVGALRS